MSCVPVTQKLTVCFFLCLNRNPNPSSFFFHGLFTRHNSNVLSLFPISIYNLIFLLLLLPPILSLLSLFVIVLAFFLFTLSISLSINLMCSILSLSSSPGLTCLMSLSGCKMLSLQYVWNKIVITMITIINDSSIVLLYSFLLFLRLFIDLASAFFVMVLFVVLWVSSRVCT